MFEVMSKKIKRVNESRLEHWCNGCNRSHSVWIKPDKDYNNQNPVWEFNNNFELPTFSPSVKHRFGNYVGPTVCHYFIIDGEIHYCADSTHKLKGEIVELPDYPTPSESLED